MKHLARCLPLIAPSQALFSTCRQCLLAGLAALFIAAGAPVTAQIAATPPKSDTDTTDEVIELSPFIVESGRDTDSYRASSTLAGTRVRTDLRDVASSISVVTSQFLKDTGAINNQTLLQYAANTEVGGVQGNFGGVGNTFLEGAREAGFGNPNTNTRVRGLDSADNTRDYLLTDIPWDSYNVGRIDLQRGPNSILFGIGSPAGIINASVNTAGFVNTREIQNRVGSFGSVRTSADFNHVLVPNQLAVRVALLADDTKYRQDPAFNDDKRGFAALRWDPAIFRGAGASTSFRVNFEHGEVDANRPRTLPPTDLITPFLAADGINRTVYDAYYAAATGLATTAVPKYLGETQNYWITGGYLGRPFNAEPRFLYDNLTATGSISDPGSNTIVTAPIPTRFFSPPRARSISRGAGSHPGSNPSRRRNIWSPYGRPSCSTGSGLNAGP